MLVAHADVGPEPIRWITCVLVERRAARLAHGQSLQLSFESLINELTAYA